jgi:hypothetical protein
VQHGEWDASFEYPDCIADSPSGLLLTGESSAFARCLLDVDVIDGDVPLPRSASRTEGAGAVVVGHLRMGLWLGLTGDAADLVGAAWQDPNRYSALHFTGVMANAVDIWPQISNCQVRAAVRNSSEFPYVIGGDPEVVDVVDHAWPFLHVAPLVATSR